MLNNWQDIVLCSRSTIPQILAFNLVTSSECTQFSWYLTQYWCRLMLHWECNLSSARSWTSLEIYPVNGIGKAVRCLSKGWILIPRCKGFINTTEVTSFLCAVLSYLRLPEVFVPDYTREIYFLFSCVAARVWLVFVASEHLVHWASISWAATWLMNFSILSVFLLFI